MPRFIGVRTPWHRPNYRGCEEVPYDDGVHPSVSVVVPTHGRAERCERLLLALVKQSLEPDLFEVIVVDDASPDDTPERVERLRASVPYRLRSLRLDVNSGPAVARNAGWRAASAELIAFIDDDCVPETDWLRAGLETMLRDARVGVCQGRTVPPESYYTEPQERWHHIQDLPSTSPYFEGCNIFYRKEALESAGGFDEEINWWGEDTALGWEVLRRGWARADGTRAVAVHDVSNRGWAWWFNSAWLERNLIRLAAEYPEFRRSAFWRPWAFHQHDVWTAVAIGSLVLSARRPSAVIGIVPYLLSAKTKPAGVRSLLAFVQEMGIDIARLAGHLVGSVENRVLVL